MKNEATKRQIDLLTVIYQYIKSTGFPPTFEEMRENLGVSSNQSIIDLLYKLEKRGLIKKSEGFARGLSLLPAAYKALGKPSLAPFFGLTSAGTPMEAIEISGEWREMQGGMAELQENIFMLRISGDSMINAGIDDGDVVLVQSKKEFVSGDVVLAHKDGEATIKRFISEDKPPYVYLKPENPKYENMLFTDTTELKGRVISVFNKDQWKSVK